MKYYLYLDEMLENLTEGVDYFSLAGFIVSEIERDRIDLEMNKLKLKHNIDGVLHWTEFRRFKDGWSTKNKEEIKVFLTDFTLLMENAEITVLASLYNAKLIQANIKSKKWMSHSHIYCMKKIFENFFIFLNKENAQQPSSVEGYIIVESSTIDEELKRLFHTVMIIGTDFVSQQGLSKFIKSIEFVEKASNNNLLQIADPIPSELHRYFKNNDNFNKKLTPYKNEIQKLRMIINEKAFSGYDNRKDLFGIHILE